MKQVFKVASFDEEGKLTLLKPEFDSYPGAETYISILEPGVYQIQKVYIKE